MSNRVRMIVVACLSAVAAGILPFAARATSPGVPRVEVIASGLDNPRGLAIGPDGAVYVAQAGRGGSGPCITNSANSHVCYGATSAITRITPFGTYDVVRRLPSLAPPPGDPAAGTEAVGAVDLVFDGRFGGVAVVGLGANPALRASLGPAGARFGRLVKFNIFGASTFDEDVAAYEAANNPDGGLVDSNPYGLAVVPSGLAVADAGANDLLLVRSSGISTAAVFPAVMVPFGPPGNMVPMQAVPTSVARGRDGALYVGQLTGFPFPPGGASVFSVFPGGVPTVFASELTNIIDVAVGRGGALYVLQISANGLLSGNPLGRLVRVAADGTRTEIAPGALISPGGLALGADGSIYVSRFATLPGAGDVVRIRD